MRILSMVSILICSAALAQVPSKMSYQGRLLDANGVPVQGSVSLRFAIFDVATGGSAIWCEQQPNVGVTEGYYVVLLGEGAACSSPTSTGLPAAFAGAERFLELSVAGAPLSPRQRIGAVPFAYTAASLVGGNSSFISNQTGTKQSAGFNISGSGYITGPAPFQGTGTVDTVQNSTAVTGHGTLFGTEVVVGDLLTINGQSKHVISVASPTSLLLEGPVTANNNAFQYQIQKVVAQLNAYASGSASSAAALVVNENGSVGVGTANPRAKLDIVLPGVNSQGSSVRSADTGINNALVTVPNLSHGGYNPLSTSGDIGIFFTGGSINSGNLVIAPWNSSPGGIRIASNGYVGIGVASPAAPLGVSGYLHVSGSTSPSVASKGAYLSWNATNSDGETDFINNRGGGVGGFSFYNATASGALGTPIATISSSGTYSASDERLKRVERPYARGLDAIRRLEPIVFQWRPESGFETDHRVVGFSAQNVQRSIPEAVEQNSSGYLMLSDRPILVTLVNAVRELENEKNEEIAALKKKNQTLEQELAVQRSDLEARMRALEKRLQ